MSKRKQITQKQIDSALNNFIYLLVSRLKEKGHGTFGSKHEILGVLEEEFLELKEAVRAHHIKGDPKKDIIAELYDIAVGAVFGAACLEQDTVDW